MENPHGQPSELNVKSSRGKRGFFPNIALNLKAPSVALVLIAWLAAVVVVAVWADERHMVGASGLLTLFGVMYFAALGRSGS